MNHAIMYFCSDPMSIKKLRPRIAHGKIVNLREAQVADSTCPVDMISSATCDLPTRSKKQVVFIHRSGPTWGNWLREMYTLQACQQSSNRVCETVVGRQACDLPLVASRAGRENLVLYA